MKTKFFSLLAAVTMLAASCGTDSGTLDGPGNTSDNTTYTLTVTNDGNGSVTANGTTVAAGASGEVTGLRAGQKVTISETANTDYTFSGWTSSNATISNHTAASTSFSMPAANVEVRATFLATPQGTGNGSDDSGTNVIDQVTDPNLKAYLTSELDSIDTNGDGKISLAEAAAVKTLDLEGLGIASLDGIQYFTGLTDLNVANNDLTSLDVSKNPLLKVLNVADNALDGTLNLAYNTGLTSLLANNNLLQGITLPAGTALQTADLADNLLQTLSLQNVLGLQSINLAGNDNLVSVDANSTQAANIGTLLQGLTNPGGLLNTVTSTVGGLINGLLPGLNLGGLLR